MSTENQEVVVEPAAEEKTETKEVKGTKRAAEVSISIIIASRGIRSDRSKEKYWLATP